jgi:anti-sigma regulatory factor (Ser/Thr protein kinase)
MAPGLARQALRGVLGTRRVADDVALVVSELVTNAVRHSGCSADQTIGFDAFMSGGCVRVAVRDPGRSDRAPRIEARRASEVGGLGLRLVAQLSRRWGSDRRDGRLVWAELAL